MRALQFWILMLASMIVCGLMIKQVFLTRELNQLQRTLLESQDVVSQGSSYENAWKQLATHIYQASRQDPTLADILRKENVAVHENTPAPTQSMPSASGTTPSTKAQVAPPHPANP
jgi:hypothetical protein